MLLVLPLPRCLEVQTFTFPEEKIDEPPHDEEERHTFPAETIDTPPHDEEAPFAFPDEKIDGPPDNGGEGEPEATYPTTKSKKRRAIRSYKEISEDEPIRKKRSRTKTRLPTPEWFKETIDEVPREEL